MARPPEVGAEEIPTGNEAAIGLFGEGSGNFDDAVGIKGSDSKGTADLNVDFSRKLYIFMGITDKKLIAGKCDENQKEDETDVVPETSWISLYTYNNSKNV